MNLPIGRLALAATTICSIALTGCTLGTNIAPATPVASSVGSIRGQAYGGNQPIVGASVYVYAAGTSGYGAASTLLSTTPAITDNNGSFTVTNDYTCTAGQQIYLYAVGGNTGAGVNSGSGLLAILGTCPASGTMASVTPYVWMNEVSTVAAAYAFSGFATDATHVADDEAVSGNSTAALAATGMANAFGNAANLADIATGTALTTTGDSSASGQTASIVVPQAQIDTIADILAACVNSSSATSSGCTTLFQTATSDGTPSGTVPTDTATAAINIAHHPAANVATLYGLINGQPAFLPDDTQQPNDFTISILYPQGGTGTVGLAVDGLGNAYGVYGGGATVYSITPAGVETALSTGATATQPRRLAIDASNNVWVPSDASSTGAIFEFSPGSTTPATYTAVDTTGATVGSLISLAFDPNNGDLWALGAGTYKRAVLLNVSGSTATAVTYATVPVTPTGLGVSSAGIVGIAGGTTTSGALYLTNDSVTAGTALTAFTGGGLYTPTQLIPDSSGDFWIANTATSDTNAVVSEFNGSGTPVSANGYSITPPANDTTTGLFSGDFDGAGNYYTGGNTYASGTTSPPLAAIYVLNTSGVQTAAFVPPSSNNQFFAVDPSGNLWFGGNKTIGEMIGVAAPTVTPIITATVDGKLTTRP